MLKSMLQIFLLLMLFDQIIQQKIEDENEYYEDSDYEDYDVEGDIEISGLTEAGERKVMKSLMERRQKLREKEKLKNRKKKRCKGKKKKSKKCKRKKRKDNKKVVEAGQDYSNYEGVKKVKYLKI